MVSTLGGGEEMMSVTVRVPGALRQQTGGKTTVEVEASDIAQALQSLESLHPTLRPLLRDDQGALRPKVQVYLNDVHIRFLQGLETPLKDGDQIYVVPIIIGG
jgi:molybdopterin converting factor small subunit